MFLAPVGFVGVVDRVAEMSDFKVGAFEVDGDVCLSVADGGSSSVEDV